ncbi:MAG: ABC transporter permease, partial [Gemmatimonadetes bacterium]|nr:ABC transporter permease [Gemmatimonadota bacterium]
MSGRNTPLVRLHRFLVRMLVPSLDQEYAAEASATFGDLYADARSGSFLGHLGLLVRELRSLVATSFSEYREERSNRRVTKRLQKMAVVGSPNDNGGSTRSSPLDVLLQDLRYALRNLTRSPGFVVVVLLSLTFGIAVSTVLFSGVNAAVLRPTPYVADPDRLVMLYAGSRGFSRGPHSYPDYLDYREMSETLEDAAAFRPRTLTVSTTTDGTREMNGLEVSENFFDLLGIRISLGRGFLEEDLAAGGRVAVIGHSVWERDYGEDPDILGRIIGIDGHPHTIVGVAPERMVGLHDPLLVEAVLPSVERRDRRGHLSYLVVGRMRDGVMVPQVQAEFEAIGEHMVEAYPNYWDHYGDDPRRITVISNKEARVPPPWSVPLLVAALGAVVALILLIACSNVANLLLTR